MLLRTRRLTGLAGVGLAALALGACGSDDGGSAGTTTGGDASDSGRVKLAQCLRKQGIDVPDDAGDGGGAPPADLDRDKLQAAIDGPCQAVSQGAFGNVSADDQQTFRDQFAGFASCMRREGVEVPDITNGPPTGGAQIDQDDPKVKAAQAKCQDLLPTGLAGAGGPGAGG